MNAAISLFKNYLPSKRQLLWAGLATMGNACLLLPALEAEEESKGRLAIAGIVATLISTYPFLERALEPQKRISSASDALKESLGDRQISYSPWNRLPTSPFSLCYQKPLEAKIALHDCVLFPHSSFHKGSEPIVHYLTGKQTALLENPFPQHKKMILLAKFIFNEMREIVSGNFISRNITLSPQLNIRAVCQAYSNKVDALQQMWNFLNRGEYSRAYAKSIAQTRLGNCYELALLFYQKMREWMPEARVSLACIEGGDHAFICVNEDLAVDPWTGGIFPIHRRDLFRSYVDHVLVVKESARLHVPIVKELDETHKLTYSPFKEIGDPELLSRCPLRYKNRVDQLLST